MVFYEVPRSIGSLPPPQKITLPPHQILASEPTIPGTCANLLTVYVSTNPVDALLLQHLPTQSAQQENWGNVVYPPRHAK